jgi:acyl-CoA reductase-like NAD-dependent aldehyde dehydrogenase
MQKLDSRNPGTGEIVGSVDVTPVAEIPAFVARARAALEDWSALSVEERCERLQPAAEHLLARVDELGALMSDEMGKPIREASGEVKAIGKGLADELAEIREALQPEVKEKKGIRSTLHRDPFGVAACVTPWNFPMLMPHNQVLPALAAGNVVIMKPSEKTPLCGQAYADAFLPGLPDGVLQIVQGDGAQGRALVAADVDLVVFTGSREAGKHILGEASKGLKRVILELGGKDPLIVLDDADVDAAAKFAARNGFRNAGQVCVSTERIYVQPRVHDEFIDNLVSMARDLTVGDALDPGTRVGPMVDAGQKAHVVAQVEQALADGAQVAYRGEKTDGNFLAPIVLTDVTHEMGIARDETFGPVVCVMRATDDEQAVRLANDTRFGLGAVVYGEADHARQIARRLSAGMIGVNQGLSTAGGMPWVGAQESGYGFHSGPDGHRQFTQARVVNERLP